MAKFTKQQIAEINKNLPAFRADLHLLMQKHGMKGLIMIKMTVAPNGPQAIGFDTCVPPHPCGPNQEARPKMLPGGNIICQCFDIDPLE
jgi:hypothetical protein